MKEDPKLCVSISINLKKLLSDIKDLQPPRREFNANITEISDYKMFITRMK